MKNYGTRFFWILAIVAACAFCWVKYGIQQGLDLAGGAALTFQAKTPEGGTPSKEQLDVALEVFDRRANAFGVGGVDLRATQDGRIILEMPGRDKSDINRIKDILLRNGELQMRILASPAEENEARQRMEQAPEGIKVKPPKNRLWFPEKDTGQMRLVEAPEQEWKDKIAAAEKDGTLNDDKQRELVDGLYKAEQKWSFTGEDLSKTGIQRPQMQWVVTFEFKDSRKQAFTEFTGSNVKRQMAIILDNEISSAPNLRTELPGGGQIEGGGVGGFTYEDANDLRIVLESGATGIDLTLESEDYQGPSLGEDAIARGQWSIGLGFIAVLFIMLFYYRTAGVVANAALMLNIVILVGALAFFGAALSLPGIAGIVLTLGMAVDANILIFERIREEKRRGKGVIEALAAGYDRALVAIVDANTTTVLTALVLIYLGSGAVKGFGVTLTLGILASMFTAIFVTRTIFELLLDKGVIDDVNLGPDVTRWNIDFMSKRAFFTGPSLVLMAIGFVFFLQRDEADSKDVEFTGGEMVTVQLEKPLAIDELRDLVSATGDYKEVGIRTLTPQGDEPEKAGTTDRFKLVTKAQTAEDGEKFVNHLKDALGDLLAPPPFSELAFEPKSDAEGVLSAHVVLHTLGDAPDAAALQAALTEAEGITGPAVKAVPDDAGALDVTFETTLKEAEATDAIRDAAHGLESPITLSEPVPSSMFLNASRAEQLWRSAIQAVLVALLIQVVYIRLRFADYKHGFAAVCALIHDTTIALGIVAVADASGLVHAKINLVLIAAFLTLIGYSMNDTIVVFDRIRENLGRGKLVLSGLVNEALSQTLTRSIRTSATTFLVVFIQFLFNRGTGSVLEGFAFVMVLGVVSGTYSSIFIAAPLLLYLPVFWKGFSRRPQFAFAQVAVTIIGGILAVTSKGHDTTMWIGAALALHIPVQFVFGLVPWLRNPSPDDLLEEEIQVEEDTRPLMKPGV